MFRAVLACSERPGKEGQSDNGQIRHALTTSNPDVETGDEIGFFHQKLNFIGPDGLLGAVDFRLRIKANVDVMEVDKGTCQFVED